VESLFDSFYFGGKTHDRLILTKISQKMTVLKQMSYLASSLEETSSTWNSSLLETSSSEKILRGIFNSISWHFDVAEFYPLELVSCRDEFHWYGKKLAGTCLC
jgi:hypothetical protein